MCSNGKLENHDFSLPLIAYRELLAVSPEFCANDPFEASSVSSQQGCDWIGEYVIIGDSVVRADCQGCYDFYIPGQRIGCLQNGAAEPQPRQLEP